MFSPTFPWKTLEFLYYPWKKQENINDAKYYHKISPKMSVGQSQTVCSVLAVLHSPLLR
jgi:hypothetical protein